MARAAAAVACVGGACAFSNALAACGSSDTAPGPSGGAAGDARPPPEDTPAPVPDSRRDETSDAAPTDGPDSSPSDAGDTSDSSSDAPDAPDTPDALDALDPDAYGGPADAAGACDGIDAGAGTPPGTRFCEIYRDIFSHPGSSKCQSSSCHGGATGARGFSMGWSVKEAYVALTTYDTSIRPARLVQPVPGGDARPKSALPIILDPKTGWMPMIVPVLGNRRLSAEESARIDAWLQRGAPMD